MAKETEAKKPAIRLAIKALAAISCGMFFLPWIRAFEVVNDAVSRSANYSGLDFVLGLNFVYYGSYPVVILLLLIPAAVLVCAFTKMR
ncbi:MAG: hypothetical protein FWD01_05605, partial [Defluviitaleaceae bacterium]|nr:hypothetical protein [Defluviitaleaceae bacterium]